MIVFNTDLDNTLIYSYKHDIGHEKVNVEKYQGRDISFMTVKAYNLMKKINEKILVVPTTTRTQEQYERIDLGLGIVKYALVCNGGVLLENGIRNEEWICESRKLIAESKDELARAVDLLENESKRKFEVRFIEEMFVFTKCNEPEKVVEDIKRILDYSLADVFNNGEKIYVIPKGLDKGTGVNRLKKYLKADRIIAAGDSEFDIPMVETADIGIVPAGFVKKYKLGHNLVETKETNIFSDALLEYIEQIIDKEV